MSQKITKRLDSDCRNGSGIMRRSSLGTPSGPGDLLFRRDLNACWKVLERRTYGSRVALEGRVGLVREKVSIALGVSQG